MMAFLLIRTYPGSEGAVMSRVKELPEVVEVAETMGGWNLFLKLNIGAKEDMGRFVKNHVNGKDIMETRSLFCVVNGKSVKTSFTDGD